MWKYFEMTPSVCIRPRPMSFVSLFLGLDLKRICLSRLKCCWCNQYYNIRHGCPMFACFYSATSYKNHIIGLWWIFQDKLDTIRQLLRRLWCSGSIFRYLNVDLVCPVSAAATVLTRYPASNSYRWFTNVNAVWCKFPKQNDRHKGDT